MTALSVYASLLAVLFVFLSFRTIRMRRKFRVAVGDGGHPPLLRAMRVHANFSEYTPITLILLFLMAHLGAPTGWIHLLGFAFVSARIAHAYGVGQLKENFRFRVFGMLTTFGVIGIASLWLLLHAALSL